MIFYTGIVTPAEIPLQFDGVPVLFSIPFVLFSSVIGYLIGCARVRFHKVYHPYQFRFTQESAWEQHPATCQVFPVMIGDILEDIFENDERCVSP